MSRFFATGTDSESDSSSEEEQVQRAPAAAFTVSILEIEEMARISPTNSFLMDRRDSIDRNSMNNRSFERLLNNLSNGIIDFFQIINGSFLNKELNIIKKLNKEKNEVLENWRRVA